MELEKNRSKNSNGWRWRAEVDRADDFGIGDGHLGGSLSCVEILVTLYFRQARVNPANPRWPERDRILLSKGPPPALYSVLALRGYIDTAELYTLDKPGTRLSKHVDRAKVAACDISAECWARACRWAQAWRWARG